MLARLSFSRLLHTSFGKMSAQESEKLLPKYTYEQLKDALKREDAVVIDVREKNELKETGEIPGSINIPVGTIEQAFKNLDNEKFLNEYGVEKPSLDTEIVLSCQAGKRSLFGQKLLLDLGFRNVYNYGGGWLDWKKNMK